MLYVLDRCMNDGVRKRLKALGYDCWTWKGDPRSKDKVIAVQALALGRVLISADWDFVDIHRHSAVDLGWHVHIIGPKPRQPALVASRIAELDARITKGGKGLYILEEGEKIKFESTGSRRGRPKSKRKRHSRRRGRRRK